MRCGDIIEKLEQLSPLSFAESWDNPGLLAGRKDKEVKVVYIALDATSEVIAEAAKVKADLLLTHHPLIFKGIKQVSTDDFVGRRIFQLIQQDICYYAMHTNFDVMGMADAAADEMNLKSPKVLDITYEDDISKEGFGRIGDLPQIMTLRQCCEYVKKCYSIDHVKVFGDLDMDVQKAVIMPGSGKSMIDIALKMGADVMITGDIDHHAGIDAWEQKMAVIDAGHFGLEKIFIPYMKEYLMREIPNLQIYTQKPECPFQII